MVLWDYVVLAGYFLVMVGIGVWSARRIHVQEDFFMGGRSFGKLLQTFAAFGAGTGSSDPVNTGRTTFTSGMSGMWSVMYWLFVTPFYWIAGVWYRRMRHLTLGDWFTERYESKALGAGYCVFGILFYMVYGSMLFSAIGKVAAPLIERDTFQLFGQYYNIEYLLVPVIGVIVLAYGILGGLRAAYFTDLIQGLCIVVLSVILIPYGLQALIERFGDPGTDSLLDGFRYMHQQLPDEYFHVVGSTSGSEFPLHRIIAVVIINLVGIVVQPHFIATGGGSAKTEMDARVGLVAGNFLKRFCTVGWVLTALIALALYANNPELIIDPDKTWGVASRELLGPGLTGLMLACLLAALMSSVDAYMIVGSGLVVRNVYAPYINPHASEAQYVLVARMTGVLVVGGAVLVSLFYMNVFQQLQLTWVFNVLFAAPFWVGLYWRRATRAAAWITVAFNVAVFFLIPFAAPRIFPQLREAPAYLLTNDMLRTTTTREAAPSDVDRRSSLIQTWEEENQRLQPQLEEAQAEFAALTAQLQTLPGEDPPPPLLLRQVEQAAQRLAAVQEELARLGARPEPLAAGDSLAEVVVSGGKGVFWPDGVKPRDPDARPRPVGEPVQLDATTSQVVLRYDEDVELIGHGNFQLDYLLYQWMGVELRRVTDATLDTLSLPPKIVTPFLVMILFSLLTRPNSKQGLDRYYSKMKTPVHPDPATDQQNLELAYQRLEELEKQKLFPGTSLEFQKPTRTDVLGFIISFGICFAIIGLAWWVAQIGR